MPLNDRKILSIILEQCSGIEERCDGYKDVIIGVIVDILENERHHRVSATNIQKKINDRCNAAAHILEDERSRATSIKEFGS
ncbi:MAG: hypothetical protein OXD43_14795 [Bacteroidetes bacterium]|nr:hypothetical protein [Bacteroidota bacterium]